MHPPQGYTPELVPEASLIGRIQEKLAASRFLTFSILFHVILLALAGGIVVVANMIPQEDFQSPTSIGTPLDDVPTGPVDKSDVRELPKASDIAVVPKTPDSPVLEDVIKTTPKADSSFTVPTTRPALKAFGPDGPALPVPTGGLSGLPSPLPHIMSSRPGGTSYKIVKEKMGMKPKSEEAVLKGLRWLKEHQNADGSWSAQFTPSMTGLAVLSFLGHGELPDAPEFGPTVKKGVDWILNRGMENGGRLSMSKQFSQSGVYEHAIATYALGEYYTMTKDDRVKDLLTQAVAHIVDGQAPDGGWQYAYAKGPDSDTSVTGWQIQALKAAHLSGLNLPGVDEAMDKAMLDLKRVQGPKGGFGYRKAEDRYSLSGAGVLCTYFWKGQKDSTVRNGIGFILDETEKNFPVKYKGEKADMYAWYYHGQACLMYGGPAWTKWNKWFQDEITDSQSPDGSWPVPGGKGNGPQGDAAGAGPFYRTTLCVLMLEVYYRYMPTNG